MGPISFLFQPDFNSAWPLFSDQHEYAGAATGKRDQHGFFPKGDLPSDQEAISVSPYDRMGPLSFHLRPQESAHRIRLDARILLDTGFHRAPTRTKLPFAPSAISKRIASSGFCTLHMPSASHPSSRPGDQGVSGV